MYSDLKGLKGMSARGSLLCLVFGRAFVCGWCDCRRCFARVGRGEETGQTGQRKAIDSSSSVAVGRYTV